MFDGDLTDGELEIGQAAAHLREILPAGAIVKQMMHDCETTINGLQKLKS
jgi:enoyl-[acyl-carrier protein] reductase II